jgi:hypothetical protein
MVYDRPYQDHSIEEANMSIQLGSLKMVFRKANKGEATNRGNPSTAFDQPGRPKGLAGVLKSTAFTPGKSRPVDPAQRAFQAPGAIEARLNGSRLW